MSVGAQAVLHPHRPTPETVFEILTRHRPTIFFGVPTLYAAMLAVKEADRRFDLSSLRLCVSAGEALPEEIYRRWHERFGTEILDGIGTTEILHIFLSNRPGATRPGSTGLPVPGYEAVVLDDEGRPAPPGEIGNLRVRGDSTMAGYWNKHDKTQGGALRRVDPDRRQVLPRRRRLLLLRGPRRRHAEGRRHLGLADRGGGDARQARRRPGGGGRGQGGQRRLVKPQAFVVLKEPETASPALADELQAFVKDKIAPYKYPRWIEFVPDLPKTATGKIQRFRLRG